MNNHIRTFNTTTHTTNNRIYFKFYLIFIVKWFHSEDYMYYNRYKAEVTVWWVPNLSLPQLTSYYPCFGMNRYIFKLFIWLKLIFFEPKNEWEYIILIF